MKTMIETLREQSEVTFYNKNGGDSLFVRVYSDGGVKIEGNNCIEFFGNIDDACSFLKRNGYVKK